MYLTSHQSRICVRWTIMTVRPAWHACFSLLRQNTRNTWKHEHNFSMYKTFSVLMQSWPDAEVGTCARQRVRPFLSDKVRWKQPQILKMYTCPTWRTAFTGFVASLPLPAIGESIGRELKTGLNLFTVYGLNDSRSHMSAAVVLNDNLQTFKERFTVSC